MKTFLAILIAMWIAMTSRAEVTLNVDRDSSSIGSQVLFSFKGVTNSPPAVWWLTVCDSKGAEIGLLGSGLCSKEGFLWTFAGRFVKDGYLKQMLTSGRYTAKLFINPNEDGWYLIYVPGIPCSASVEFSLSGVAPPLTIRESPDHTYMFVYASGIAGDWYTVRSSSSTTTDDEDWVVEDHFQMPVNDVWRVDYSLYPGGSLYRRTRFFKLVHEDGPPAAKKP